VRIISGALLCLAVMACGKEQAGSSTDSTAAVSSGSVDLTGAGATFPTPLYSKWFSDYAARTGVRINYQSIGSGGGIRQVSEETVDLVPPTGR
jgi:phosphate transport system substrate-binding protein